MFFSPLIGTLFDKFKSNFHSKIPRQILLESLSSPNRFEKYRINSNYKYPIHY